MFWKFVYIIVMAKVVNVFFPKALKLKCMYIQWYTSITVDQTAPFQTRKI